LVARARGSRGRTRCGSAGQPQSAAVLGGSVTSVASKPSALSAAPCDAVCTRPARRAGMARCIRNSTTTSAYGQRPLVWVRTRPLSRGAPVVPRGRRVHHLAVLAGWSGTARPGRRCSSRRSRSAGLTSRWARLSSRGGP